MRTYLAFSGRPTTQLPTTIGRLPPHRLWTALIVIETPSPTSPSGMLIIHTAMGEAEDGECDSTPECTKPTVASIGMPGPWSACSVNRDGEILLHRNMPTSPKIFLKAIAPSRQDLVVAVDCMLALEGNHQPRTQRDRQPHVRRVTLHHVPAIH